MADLVFPGVYVEEIGHVPKSIEGVPTSVAAFLGMAAKGPFAPSLVQSLREYEALYGTRPVAGSYLGAAIRTFFANGGKRAWIARVADGSVASHIGTAERIEKEETLPATGLTALADIDEIGLVAAPGAAADVQRALVTHCEKARSRMAILDGPRAPWDASKLDPRGADPALGSAFAAYYAPWIEVEASRGTGAVIPPSGAVCGIMARVDGERGVWKAPANETVMGVRALDKAIGEDAQSILNPRGVNCIRNLPGRGIRLWGARTLSPDGEWRYVSIRRLVIYIEQSLERGLQWAVFEPNESRLWAQVRLVTENFLYRIWLDGGLQGSKADEAFFVRADRSTMTQADLDEGRLVMEIGIAPIRPAEFIILRIKLKTAGSPA